MNITKENIDALNAKLRVELTTDDYQEKVNAVLADYRKKAEIPGFRKGKVPMGIIKKRFGTSAKVEEINKSLSESINNYLNTEELDILGNPLPIDAEAIDWENQEDFVFEYELGLTPEFEVKITKRNKLDYFKITADEAAIDKFSDDVAKRYGKVINPDAAAAGDLVYGEFIQADADGNVLENGLTNKASLALDNIKDAELSAQFIDSGVGTIITLSPMAAFEDENLVASMLGIKAEDAGYQDLLAATYQFKVENVSRVEPAELNEELFAKIYPDGSVTTVEAFRAKIKEEAEAMYVVESDRKLMVDVTEYLLEKLDFELPNEFLKRWLLMSNEGKLTQEQLDAEYDDYSNQLKWQIIENRIAKDNDIRITKEDMITEAKVLIAQQMKQYGQDTPEDKELEGIAHQVLSNKEEEKRLFEKLYADKLVGFYKESFKLEESEVTFDEFVAMVNKK